MKRLINGLVEKNFQKNLQIQEIQLNRFIGRPEKYHSKFLFLFLVSSGLAKSTLTW